MRRKFTVYGLRFSKTSFWNRINTGFLDPAVATVLTACGIETVVSNLLPNTSRALVATVLTACGIETLANWYMLRTSMVLKLQQCLPLAVLKLLLHYYYLAYSLSCNSAYRLRY